MTSTILVVALVLADPVVVKNATGFGDGAVSVVSKADKKLELRVQKQFDAAALVSLLKDKLPGASVTQSGDIVVVSGLSSTEALDRMSALHVEPVSQNLFAMDMPEAGGSIRVGKAVDLAATEPQHEERERFRARVKEVKRGDFPEVTLTLKRGGDVKSAEVQKKLKYIFTARVAFVRVGAQFDLNHKVTQKNLVATYLKPGDEVLVHVTFKKTESGEEPIIDWLERI